MFAPKIVQHCHWNFRTYESKSPQHDGMAYVGAAVIDVVTVGEATVADARRKVMAMRPIDGELGGYELQAVTEHVAGTCWPK